MSICLRVWWAANFWPVFTFALPQTRSQHAAQWRIWQLPLGGLVCLHFFICSLDDNDDDTCVCVCSEEVCGVGGNDRSVTVALMSHECLDETLRAVFFVPAWVGRDQDQMLSCNFALIKFTSIHFSSVCFYSTGYNKCHERPFYRKWV